MRVWIGAVVVLMLSGCTPKVPLQTQITYHESTTPVVFENGLAGEMGLWEKVNEQLSPTHTTFLYNRPSYGLSENPTTSRTAEHIVDELRTALQQANLKPPYILVGHSIGGLYMQYFARRYPEEVKGLVLVDSTHPEQMLHEGSSDNWPWWVRVLFDWTLNKAQKEEFELSMPSGKSILALPSPANVKVVVLSAQKPMKEHNKLADYANRLRSEMILLYPHGQQIWVDSGHVVPLEHPDSIVMAVEAIE